MDIICEGTGSTLFFFVHISVLFCHLPALIFPLFSLEPFPNLSRCLQPVVRMSFGETSEKERRKVGGE